MTWRIVGKVESGQTQRNVTDAAGVARSVSARLWIRFQISGRARYRPRQGRSFAALANNDQFYPVNSLSIQES